MIRPHELDEQIVHDPAAQQRYEEYIDSKLSTHDFKVRPELFIETPAGVSLADRAVVLAKYGAAYELPDGSGSAPGWVIQTAQSGVFFKKPVTRDSGDVSRAYCGGVA